MTGRVYANHGFHSVALKRDGTLWVWGLSIHVLLGLAGTWGRFSPVQRGTDNNWATVAPGSFGNLVIKTNGTL